MIEPAAPGPAGRSGPVGQPGPTGQPDPAWCKMALVVLFILQSVCLDVVGAAFAVGAYFLQKLPAELPTRFDPGGEPVAFTSAAAAVFLYPALAAVVHILLSLPTWLDRKAAERRSFYFGPWLIFQAGVVLYLLSGEVFTILRGLGKMTSFPLLPAAGFLMVLLGLVLPAFPPDARFGIRLRATRASNLAWKKAHTYGGQVLIAAGLVPRASSCRGSPSGSSWVRWSWRSASS